MTATLSRIYRYPVKSLTAEPLEEVALEPGRCLPGDRRFAIAHGASRFDRLAPDWAPKSSFVALVRCERLARLESRLDPESGELTIRRGGKVVAHARVDNPAGRTVLDQFLSAFLGEDARGSAHLVEAPGRALSDHPEPWVSLISLASVRDLERVVRAPVDPVRFRANLYIDGLEPWREFGWVGREIAVGPVRLRVEERIGRCAATNVDPVTAARDLNIPRALEHGFGHAHMGVYAEVVEGGRLAVGDPVTPPD